MSNSNKNEYSKSFSNEMNSLLKKLSEDMLGEIPVKEITTEYFLTFALEKSDCMLYKAVNGFLNSITIDKLHSELFGMIQGNTFSAIRPNTNVGYSDDFRYHLSKANEERKNMGSKFITSDHVLLAVLNDDNKWGLKEIFKKEGLTYKVLLDESYKLHDITVTLNEAEEKNEPIEVPQTMTVIVPAMPLDFSRLGNIIDSQAGRKKKNGIQFCRNLNGLASIGKIDPVIGRIEEIQKIEKVFARRRCNNVILVGKSGVGKSCIVEGLAKMIQDKKAPLSLLNKTIYAMKVSDILSGTSLRGMFEERVGKIFAAMKEQKNCILFVDDAHTIINGSKKDDFDLLSAINDNINDSDIQIIMATTQSGYRTVMNSNPDMKRRFQRIDVDPLSSGETVDVLTQIKPVYEKYHNVKYTDDIISKCVKLSERYITDTPLPASAIAIMDETGALKKIANSEPEELKEKLKRFNELNEKKDELIRNDNINESEALDAEIDELKSEISELTKRTDYSEEEMSVTEDELNKAVSQHTGIPVSKITVSERKSLANIEATLKKTIVGQDKALESVSNAIKRNKIGLYKKKRPIGSFFFLGGSGTGKTLTAKTLAKEIFGDEKYLVRFDMSEYADKTSVNKLIGAGAGYIGYDNGGLLTEAIKNRKHAVLLFDEIEKADDEVYNLLLQVLDEATLTDNMGNKVDFTNTIIIFTSNVGARKASEEHAIGFVTNESIKKEEVIKKELKKRFPPEFINRLDDIVYYNDLTDENMDAIIRLELNKLVDRLKELGYGMKYDKNTVDFIFNEALDEKGYGARPIIRIIEKNIENKITDMIIENDYKSYTFDVTAEQDKILIE